MLLKLCFFFLVLAFSVAFPGHELGNGGRRIDFNSYAMWVNPSIKTDLYWCIGSEGPDNLIAAVNEAYNKWNQYLSKRRVKIPHLKQATDCEMADVRILFGIQNPLNEPVNFANMAGYSYVDSEYFESNYLLKKGSIWINSSFEVCPRLVPGGCKKIEWKKDNLVRILTHELGHVLGMPHIEGTIMRENIGATFDNRRLTTDFNSIDQEALLFPDFKQNDLLEGKLLPKEWSNEKGNILAAKIFGEEQKTDDTAILQLLNWGAFTEFQTLKAKLVLRVGEKNFDISLLPFEAFSKSKNEFLYESTSEPGFPVFTTSQKSSTSNSTLIGTIQTIRGERISVIITINLSTFPTMAPNTMQHLNIVAFDENLYKTIFSYPAVNSQTNR
jgi:hypothetical protein